MRRSPRPTARLVTVLAILAAVAVSSTPATAAEAAPTAPSHPLLAADYFGTANPINFWTSNLSGAPADFARMRADGFNAIGLVVPWGYFEPRLDPPRFNAGAFARLDGLVATAARVNMRVILRLSYDWDLYPPDEKPGTARMTALFASPRLYLTWLGYIGELAKNLAPFPNVAAHYLSWEDFWFPVSETLRAGDLGDRVRLATRTGYRSWLASHYSLAQINRLYGTRFSKWTQVPVPRRTAPALQLVYRYDTDMIVNKFFAGAQRMYPGLTMETRVDQDPIYNGRKVVAVLSHDAMYRLQGTTMTGMYFSPYMNDPSTARRETTAQALAGLETTISSLQGKAGGRPIYMYEFEFADNDPRMRKNPQLGPNQLGPFLMQSAPILGRLTIGYGLWTYRDYHLSAVVNPSFSLGRLGWHLSGPVKVIDRPGDMSRLAMGPGGSADQVVHMSRVQTVRGSPLELSLQASSPSRRGTLSIALAGNPPQTVTLAPGWHTYHIRVTADPSSDVDVTISARSHLSIREIQLYNFTQEGGIYGPDGRAKPGLPGLRSLNRALSSAPSATS